MQKLIMAVTGDETGKNFKQSGRLILQKAL